MSLIEKFEACTLAPGEFRHRQHVEVAWSYLSQYPPAEALARFAANLRRYAASLGAPSKYHETITWAYLLLINQRRACTSGPDDDFETFARKNDDLFQPDAIARFYTPETLASPLARRVFLLPDAVAAR
jgi:hypothetical protein